MTAKKKQKYLSAEDATARLPIGRKPGSKNKTTIFKEVIREGFEDMLEKYGMSVIEAVAIKAIGPALVDEEGELVRDAAGNTIHPNGDMTAAKLLLDRILPTSKAIDLEQLERSKGLSISINIGSLEQDEPTVVEGEVVVDAES